MMVVVSYDIPDNRRRLLVAKALRNVGERVQKSVFEIHLETDHLKAVMIIIERIIESKEDSVRFYPICASCKRAIEIIGLGTVTEEQEVYIL